MTGTFIILLGPSGSGKNTLLKHVKETFPQIHFPLSYVSRPPRPGERDGDAYYFISVEKFEEMIERGDFLEWAEYGGNLYGTAKESITPYLETGGVAMKLMEVQGARIVKDKLPSKNIHTIFIDAGDWETLRQRITNRADISSEELEKRHQRFLKELEFKPEVDTIIHNEDGKLEEAKTSIETAIRGILEA